MGGAERPAKSFLDWGPVCSASHLSFFFFLNSKSSHHPILFVSLFRSGLPPLLHPRPVLLSPPKVPEILALPFGTRLSCCSGMKNFARVFLWKLFAVWRGVASTLGQTGGELPGTGLFFWQSFCERNPLVPRRQRPGCCWGCGCGCVCCCCC